MVISASVIELADAVEQTTAGSDERLEALVRLATHPCAWHAVLATEVWTEISDLHRQRQQWDQAIEAWEHAIRLGYRSAPHPRAQIAELLVLAGPSTSVLPGCRRTQVPTISGLRFQLSLSQ